MKTEYIILRHIEGFVMYCKIFYKETDFILDFILMLKEENWDYICVTTEKDFYKDENYYERLYNKYAFCKGREITEEEEMALIYIKNVQVKKDQNKQYRTNRVYTT